MKYLKIFLCLLLISVMLSGCNFKISSSIDDLISPLSPFGDNADVKNALDDYTKGGYSLKIPSAGKYITSFIFFDIDKDGDDEAIAFYEPSDNLGTIHMAVIKKGEDGWKVIQNIVGAGRDIHSIDFGDISGDGRSELFVCWDVISNSSSHELMVYTYDGEGSSQMVAMDEEGMTLNNYILADLYGDDNISDLLVLKVNTGTTNSAGAELYTVEGNALTMRGETKLDAHITSYDNLSVEKVEGETRVYADALGTDGASMLTEILYWSDAYHSVVSPFYSYATGLTQETARSCVIPASDVNDDGRIDIPCDDERESLPKQVAALDYKTFKNTILMHTSYAFYPKNDGYIVLIPDEIVNRVRVTYDASRHEMTVTDSETNAAVYAVMPVLKATYSEEKYQGYTKVTEASGYCYLVKPGNDSNIQLSATELEQYIKALN